MAANVYPMRVAQILPHYVVLHGYMGTNAKNPVQPTEIIIRADNLHASFTVGQRVDVDVTLTPYVNGVAQATVQP